MKLLCTLGLNCRISLSDPALQQAFTMNSECLRHPMSAQSKQPTYFEFEADFVAALRCIPMQVRYNLDSCGIKLKLEHWNHFSPDQKQALAESPCQSASEVTAYGDRLQAWVTAQTGSSAKTLAIDPEPAWLNGNVVPEVVLAKAEDCGLAIAPQQWLEHWAGLSPLQRFALIKLSRPSHENRNFLPAMQEFGLV